MPAPSTPAGPTGPPGRAPAVRALARGVLELLAPSRCLACRVRAEPPWCRRCRPEVEEVVGACRRCGAPRGPGHPCWSASAPIASTVAVYHYRGPVAAAVVTAKVAGASTGWAPLGHALADRVAADPPDVDAVTWVSTAPGRRRRRGLDHAQRLAAVVAARLTLPLVRTLEAREGPDGRDRYRSRPLPGSNLLLVDDVLTTGATALRAAGALRDAGAGELHLAVVARAGPHPLAGHER